MDAKQIQAVIEEVLKEVMQAKAATNQPNNMPIRQSQSASQYISKPSASQAEARHINPSVAQYINKADNQPASQTVRQYTNKAESQLANQSASKAILQSANQVTIQPTSQSALQPANQSINQGVTQPKEDGNIIQTLHNMPQKAYPKQDKAVPPPTAIPASVQNNPQQAARDNGLLLDNPIDTGALVRMKSFTSARIGVGKAGTRLKTDTMLKLRADHAAARDAVFKDVQQDYIDKLGLRPFVTLCQDKNEYLTRPDLGRQFAPKELEEIAATAGKGSDVLIYASDGLSSTAITHNLHNILPVLMDGLKAKGLKVAQPFFVKFGRVGAMDSIAQATGAAVTCVLIGERPGLATAESMSAYIAYNASVGMPEARRTVVSNIHKGGTAAVEAGAYICDIIHTIYKAKASGVELLARSNQ